MRRVAFLLPHPDDEFAVALPIRDLCRSGVRVEAIFLTDGGFGGQDRDRREAESRSVLSALGVEGGQVHFLGRRHQLPDGALHRHLDAALAALVNVLGSPGALDAIHVPAWEGGHQDHDAAHLLGLALARRCTGSELRQFPLYRAVGRAGPLFRVMAPLPANGRAVSRRTSVAERIAHLRLCASYRSQWRSWLGLWPLTLLHHLLDGRFSSQHVDPTRVLAPPHEGAPLYERRGFLTWREFAQTTESFRIDPQSLRQERP